MKRYLTTDEINDILSFLKPNPSLPKETTKSIICNLKERYSKQLESSKVNPKIIPELKKKIEQEHYKSLIDPGESIGILAAQSIGEKNTQSTLNSIDWKDKILYSEKGAIKIECIGKTIDELLYKNSEKIERIEENRTEYLNIENENFFIPSCDENGVSDWYKIEAVTKHLPVGKLVKVITQSGREVTATQSKSFLVWNELENKFIPTCGSDIKIGDIVPTTHYLQQFENAKIQEYIIYQNTKIYLTQEIGYAIGLYLNRNGENIKIRLPYEIDIEDFLDNITLSGTSVPMFSYNSTDEYIKGLILGFLQNAECIENSVECWSYYEDLINSLLFL